MTCGLHRVAVIPALLVSSVQASAAVHDTSLNCEYDLLRDDGMDQALAFFSAAACMMHAIGSISGPCLLESRYTNNTHDHVEQTWAANSACSIKRGTFLPAPACTLDAMVLLSSNYSTPTATHYMHA